MLDRSVWFPFWTTCVCEQIQGMLQPCVAHSDSDAVCLSDPCAPIWMPSGCIRSFSLASHLNVYLASAPFYRLTLSVNQTLESSECELFGFYSDKFYFDKFSLSTSRACHCWQSRSLALFAVWRIYAKSCQRFKWFKSNPVEAEKTKVK